MDIFLTRAEKGKLSQWKYQVVDNSFSTKLMTPFWDWLVSFVPNTVAPNILTLTGFLCVLYSYHLCYNYLDHNTNLFGIGLSSILLIFAYMNLDAIDGKHARRIQNGSPLGELFDHSCDNIGVIFMLLTLTSILNIQNVEILWYIVQIGQLLFLGTHIDAFEKKYVEFGYYSGSGEFLFFQMGAMLVGITIGFDWVGFGIFSEYHLRQTVFLAYYSILAWSIIKIVGLKDKHDSTRNGLIISLLTRFIPSFLMIIGYENDELTISTVISHGLIMTILTGDMIVAKMANRELHPLVPILVMISLFDNFFCATICILYYTIVLFEISYYLKIPMFTVRQNVFCCGVFDLFHIGHMNMFTNAKTFGTNLIVGVHDDMTCEKYKRKTHLTHEERVASVRKCASVDTVIPECPLILTENFIKKHNIHTVICSEEYDNDDDIYYKVARDMGITKIVKRTSDVSTSDIIERVKKQKKLKK